MSGDADKDTPRKRDAMEKVARDWREAQQRTGQREMTHDRAVREVQDANRRSDERRNR